MRKHLVIAAFAIAAALAGQNQAKAQTNTPTIQAGGAVQDFSARRAHRHSHRYRGARHGRCDGFHGCRCGVTAARRHGLPLVFHGHNLKQAVEYTLAFPQIASPVPGAVGYQRTGGPTGHVFTVEGMTKNRCKLRVSDDKGTYERDVCRHATTYVHVTG